MQVLDDGSHVQLAPERRFHDAVAHLLQPQQLPRLTQEQAEVLAIVISDGMATRRRIEGGPGRDTAVNRGRWARLAAPRQPSTLALLLSARPALCRSGRSCQRATTGLPAHAAAAPAAPGGNA